ncbi:hypothetical protein VV02_18750 [Luteipulveratus mongoliensis]|uniref:Uncharacterized protein n=1 Tax=Luteipulveratus mongoliensis TaxID=571913 RepID=A0A0K1JL03_9MICO|nr:hypothetical protein VV02_18750 [Luteipulveratus mongoliensis]
MTVSDPVLDDVVVDGAVVLVVAPLVVDVDPGPGVSLGSSCEPPGRDVDECRGPCHVVLGSGRDVRVGLGVDRGGWVRVGRLVAVGVRVDVGGCDVDCGGHGHGGIGPVGSACGSATAVVAPIRAQQTATPPRAEARTRGCEKRGISPLWASLPSIWR